MVLISFYDSTSSAFGLQLKKHKWKEKFLPTFKTLSHMYKSYFRNILTLIKLHLLANEPAYNAFNGCIIISMFSYLFFSNTLFNETTKEKIGNKSQIQITHLSAQVGLRCCSSTATLQPIRQEAKRSVSRMSPSTSPPPSAYLYCHPGTQTTRQMWPS